MGLNSSYEGVRSQILMLDPLPSVSKAYSMILHVEKQRQINIYTTYVVENSVLLDKSNFKSENVRKGNS